jgi:hypothetical protein
MKKYGARQFTTMGTKTAFGSFAKMKERVSFQGLAFSMKIPKFEYLYCFTVSYEYEPNLVGGIKSIFHRYPRLLYHSSQGEGTRIT